MPTREKNKYFDKEALLVILIVFLVLSALFLAWDIGRIYRSGTFKQRRSIAQLLQKNRTSNKISTSDTGYIADWMTFRYVNFIFNLPGDYLKNTFGIDDPHYPNITLGHWAKEKNLNKNDFIEKVKTSVHGYLSSQGNSQ